MEFAAVILGFMFGQLSNFTPDMSLQLRPNLWHLDFLCVRDKSNFSTKGGAFALSGKGVEVHIFSTGIFEHDFIKTRVTYVYGGTDTVGRGTQIACVVGGQEVGIAKECEFFSYAFSSDSEFVAAVDSFLTYKNTVTKKPTVVLIDIDRTPRSENRNIMLFNDSVELAIEKITDLNYIVLVPAGDGFTKNGELVGALNAAINSPARLDSVFAIGACDFNSTPAAFSNYGVAVNAVAPGCGVVTGTLDNKRIGISSTRIAMACVAGIAVEFLQQNKTATKKEFNSFIKNHFFNMGLVEYLDYYLAHDPVYTPDEDDNFASFWYGSSAYSYRFPFIDSYLLAYCPYVKSKIIIENDLLSDVVANLPFVLQLEVESRTVYNEKKPLLFKLVGNKPAWISLEVGETSGKLFGSSTNVPVRTPCVFQVQIEDGLYLVIHTFTFFVLANQRELFGIGARLKAMIKSDVILNLDELKKVDLFLNVDQTKKKESVIAEFLPRKIFLLDRVTGNFVSRTKSNNTGEFSFYVPFGIYQALAIDESSKFSASILNNLRT